MTRKDIEFQNSVGITLRGWLYTPSDTTPELLPCVVAAHGFSALKEMGLDALGEAFVANLKIAVLIFDNRGFGASDAGTGQPRLEIIPSAQISDYSDAVTYAQSLPEVDSKKIGVWGSSYSGGHVLAVAATDKRVKAVISQVPFVDGPTTFSRLIRPGSVAALEAKFEADRQARAAGKAAATLPVAVAECHLKDSALSTPDAFPFFNSLDEKIPWKNEATLRSMELMRAYAPHQMIEFVSPAPMLMIVADRDILTAADLSLKAYAKALEPKELLLLNGGHFDAYEEANAGMMVKRQIEFLHKNLCT